MANSERLSGVDSYLLYGAETTFGTAASSIASVLGLIQSVSPSINRAVKENRGFAGSSGGGQAVQSFTSGAAEISWSAEFQPINWAWLQYLMGAVSGDGSSGTPYSYTFSNQPSSLTFANCIDNATTDRDLHLLGTLFDSVTIRASVGEPVQITANFKSANVEKDTTVTANVALPSGDVYSFVGATLEIPNTSAISNIIDSIEITISRNAEIYSGLGAYYGKAGLYKARELKVNFTVKYLDEGLIEKVIGSTSALTTLSDTTLTVKFANGSSKYAYFSFGGVVFPEYNSTQNINEIIEEGLSATCKTLTVTERTS